MAAVAVEGMWQGGRLEGGSETLLHAVRHWVRNLDQRPRREVLRAAGGLAQHCYQRRDRARLGNGHAMLDMTVSELGQRHRAARAEVEPAGGRSDGVSENGRRARRLQSNLRQECLPGARQWGRCLLRSRPTSGGIAPAEATVTRVSGLSCMSVARMLALSSWKSGEPTGMSHKGAGADLGSPS